MITRRFLCGIFTALALLMAANSGQVVADSHPQAGKPAAGEAASAGIGPVGNNFLISNESPLVEVNPVVAYNSTRSEYLVVWYNDRPANDDIRARRVAKDGRLLGGPFYISAGGAGIDRRYPAIAYDVKADQYLVVWEHQDSGYGYSIRGRRVSGTGQVLDASDIVIRSAGGNTFTPARPTVAYAYTSDKYLVVWEETWHPLPISTSIYGQKVLVTGALEGGHIVVSQDPGGSPRTQADLAYNPGRNEYLVAWQQLDILGPDIYARRVTGDGVPLFPEETWIYSAPVIGISSAPAVAALPVLPDGVYLVVWEDYGTSTDSDIAGRTVESDGTPFAGLCIACTIVDETAPAVAGSQSLGRWLITWKQLPNPSFTFANIMAGSVSPADYIISSIINLGGFVADHPGVAAGPNGDFLVVFDDSPLTPDRGIYGQLVGDRVYIPLVRR